VSQIGHPLPLALQTELRLPCGGKCVKKKADVRKTSSHAGDVWDYSASDVLMTHHAKAIL